jgi:alkylation response protein AidB-like acyl-CoA dehydrogenase
MEFGLGEQQRLLDDSLRALLADRLPLETLREIAEAGQGGNDDLGQSLAELGLPGLLIPEALGGAGFGLLDAAVAAEALGFAATPTPYLASAVMAPRALAESASEAQQQAWLPRIASGEARMAMAFAGLTGSTAADDLKLDGEHLSGRMDGVLDAARASQVLIYLPDGRAVLLDCQAHGVATSLRPSLDRTRPLVDLELTNTPVEILDAANQPLEAAKSVIAAGRVMLAADTLGAAQKMLDDAVAYAGERVQFGRTIASFQAVKHLCAEMVTMLEPCRALVWYAAYAQDIDADDRLSVASHAKAHLAEVGREVSRAATEIHGGMGFTDLLGLHYWFKRISFNRQIMGGSERCRHDAALAQGWIEAEAG